MLSKTKLLQRGKKGEQQVVRELQAISNIYVLNNIILEYSGKKRQIDHIIICPKGIFVLETKNYSGAIYYTHGKFTIVIGRRFHTTSNDPARQVTRNAYFLQKILIDNNNRNINIKPLIIFVGDVLLDGVKNLSVCCLKPEDIKDYILSLPNILNNEKCFKIYQLLKKTSKPA